MKIRFARLTSMMRCLLVNRPEKRAKYDAGNGKLYKTAPSGWSVVP
jgi:hypothetical protein